MQLIVKVKKVKLCILVHKCRTISIGGGFDHQSAVMFLAWNSFPAPIQKAKSISVFKKTV
jgi:hypothetical protein